MRNLALVDHDRHRVAVPSEGRLCVDPVTRAVYYVCTQGVQLLGEGEGGVDSFPGLRWEEHRIATQCVVNAEVVIGIASLCVVTREGEVITVGTDTTQVEVVGDVEAGIEAASWSPDQELLVLVTAEAKLVLMTASFDLVAETPLHQASFGEQSFVSVGWGKKETQFHGSEGKGAARVAKAPLKPVPEWDDRRPRVTWRGDGELFAVGYVVPDTSARRVVVVNCEGVLQATSEDLAGLESPLAWKPSGSLLASSQTLGDKHDIAFLEKNGLKHGGFTLPSPAGRAEVKELAWTADSSILLVWLRTLADGGDVIQLWTSGNYHWYLKREMRVEEEEGGVRCVLWVESTPVTLRVLTATHLHHYALTPTTDASHGATPHDTAAVAVVDGPRLCMTPFRYVTVPPPLAAYYVTFPESVNAVAFSGDVTPEPGDAEDSGFLEVIDHPGDSSNSLCVQHGANDLSILTLAPLDQPPTHTSTVTLSAMGGGGSGVRPRVHGLFGQYTVECDPGLDPTPPLACQMYNWVWVGRTTLLACFREEGAGFLAVLELREVGAGGGRVVVGAVLPVEEPVVGVAASLSAVALQLLSGAVLRLDLTSRTLQPFTVAEDEVCFPSPCQNMRLCPLNNGSLLVPLGLTARNRLYLGGRQLLANCTSYHLHTSHLLATTTQHTLLAVPLTSQALGALAEGVVPGSRRVERGARLVTAVPHDTRVVLQMPRGNLEVVSPRPLAVHTLAHLLAAQRYGQAVEMARRHRVDANLLHDHDPHSFLANVDHFVRDVGDPQRIDVFLANLSEADVSATTYAFHYQARPSHPAEEGKVLRVCEALRAALVELDEERFLLPILTSLVRTGQMEAALRRVKELRDGARDGRLFKVPAEEGMRHLLYLSDANELFDLALGTYDFELVMMVAERSQKDPKEYLPFLNQLQALDLPLRRFRINVHLRRFRRALECLLGTDGHWDECLALVEAEKLHREALQVFPAASDINRAVCASYARHLSAKGQHGEAAVLLGRAGELEAALEAYQRAGNWRMCLVLATQLGRSREGVRELCRGLVNTLRDRGRLREAARLLEEYLTDEEEATECLVEAGEWDEALRVAHRYSRQDLLDTHVRPGAQARAEALLAEINTAATTLDQHITRLTKVREAKEVQATKELTEGDTQLDTDLYSDASTITGASHHRSSTSSAASSRTFRSSKNRRKLERKKHSTREGSVFEDLGLVTALHDLYVRITGLTDPTAALCCVLVTFGLDREAAQLQTTLSRLLKLADKRKGEIWPSAAPLDEEVEFGPQLTTDGAVKQLRTGNTVSFVARRMQELDPHLRHPPPPTTDAWTLHMLRQEKEEQ